MMMFILTIIAIIILAVFAICRFLVPRAQQLWLCSSGEEKIGLSKNKLYNANGYIVSKALWDFIAFTTASPGDKINTGM